MGFTLYTDDSDSSQKTNNIPMKNLPVPIDMNEMEMISMGSENETIDAYPSFKKSSPSKVGWKPQHNHTNAVIRKMDEKYIHTTSSKPWHPSQDMHLPVYPILNEFNERKMRRKLNSPTKRDKSTQTPEQNREEVTSISNTTTSAKSAVHSTQESSNTAIAESVNGYNKSVVSHRSKKPRFGGSFRSRYYNQEEEKAILNFIVNNRRYSEVNGKALWIMMEEKNVVANRSWQSMKERYRKYIAPNLGKFSNLNSSDIKQLNKYLSAVSKHIKYRTT